MPLDDDKEKNIFEHIYDEDIKKDFHVNLGTKLVDPKSYSLLAELTVADPLGKNKKSISLTVSPEDQKRTFDALVSLMKKIITAIKSHNGGMDSINEFIFDAYEEIEELASVAKLNIEDKKDLIKKIIDLILDNVKLNIKLGGKLPLPWSLVKTIIKPFIHHFIDSIINTIIKKIKK